MSLESDKTAEEMKNIIENLSKEDHSKYDCAFIAVFSHGCKGAVYGCDGEKLKISDIQKPIQSCSKLYGKPKVFLIQACRGSEVLSYKKTDGSYDAEKADCLIGYSTVKGCVSFRDEVFGSWYIQDPLNL